MGLLRKLCLTTGNEFNNMKDKMDISDIELNMSRDSLFDELGLKRLKESYMMEHEISPQERFAFVSAKFGSNKEHAQRLYEYSSKHWLSYSTPILAFGRNPRGMPISCFLNYLEDTSAGLVDTLSETNWLSMMGGGVGVHVGIRGADEKSAGVMPHLKTYDASSLAYKQGSTRRGSYAAYLDIFHPDIIQFLEMRKPTGDQNMRTLNLNHGINVPNKFMEIIERCMVDPHADDSWDLVQPHNGKVVETVSAKALWMKILELRMQTGEPYLWFIDRANEGVPEYQKAIGLKNHGSNLCSEISLVTSKERTAVCCLSSVNIEYYDDWSKDELFLSDILEMLDNVIQYFVDNAPDTISRAKFSAMRERSVGVGALGYHAYLQKNNIAFEGAIAKSTNIRIFKHIRTCLDRANYSLAVVRGACPDAADFGVMKRCSHVMAIAPNASSSIIMGNTSPSTEPYSANAYRQDTTSGAFVNKNKYLNELIITKSKGEVVSWYDDTWASIISNDGSVSHLDWMDEYTKSVYKTAPEIDQRWIIEQASDRQVFVDQAMSVNLFFRPDVNVKYLHAVHFQAWKQGLKSLYYVRSSKLRKSDKVGQKVVRRKIEDEIDIQSLVENNTCLACE
jgi:ribonucleoside-diphosphate reductase alpha chain